MGERPSAGLRIVFGRDLDGGAWPGSLGTATSNAGEAWFGPRGLIERLELDLGVPARRSSPLARAATLLPRLNATAGFWSASARVDGISTAERLLELRDALALEGWSGEPASARLASLWAVTEGLPPGTSDRLSIVARALSKEGTRIEALDVAPERVPPLWARVFNALEARGVSVRRLPSPSGTLVVPGCRVEFLRPRGVLEAAEESAAWLASGAVEGSLVIGATPLLDEALQRHGLPALGARANQQENPYQAVLPAALAIAFGPVRPRSALDLLELPKSPVPRSIARRLQAALGTWPSVTSEAWREALLRGEAELAPNVRDVQAARVRSLFTPAVAATALCPRAELERRAELVRAWLNEELATAENANDERAARNVRAALVSIATFGEALASSGIPALGAAEVSRFVDRAVAEAPCVPRRLADAGFGAVSSSGCVLGPARRILWWSFREPSRATAGAHLSRSELAALSAAGVRVPEAWEHLADEAERDRRALQMVSDAVLLVRPERDEAGRPCPVPTLAVELALATGCKVVPRSRLDVGPNGPKRLRATLQRLPVARRAWTVKSGSVSRRERESPSSIASLVGCSFRWALRYGARLADRRPTLAEGSLLNGLLAHELLGRTLVAPGSATPLEPGAVFDAEATHLAASLFMPGRDAERARVRAVFIASVNQLRTVLSAAGKTVVASEVEIRDPEGFVVPLEGRPDLVLGPAPVVVDLKWGARRRHEAALAGGTALQLAMYAHLVRLASGRQELPAVAYYVLSAARLLATDVGELPGAWKVDGPPLEVTLQALGRSVSSVLDRVGRGELEALGVLPNGELVEDAEDAMSDGVIFVAPPCWSCAFDGLCGRAFGPGRGS